MTIKNAALIGIIAISIHAVIWFIEIVYRAIIWNADIWTFIGFLYIILLDGSLIFFLSVVYYNHQKKEKINQ